jgi:hypothetical protein
MVHVRVKLVNVKMSVPCSSVNGFFTNEYNSHDLTEIWLNMDENCSFSIEQQSFAHSPDLYYMFIGNLIISP